MMMNEKNRGTGRSTRMMKEAKALARAGKAVYVVATTPRFYKFLEDEETRCLGIKFEAIGSVPNLCWGSLKFRDVPIDHVVLIDHYAIETYFPNVFEMLHRYDKEKPNAE